jgi:hypothetical protein
MTFLNSSDNIMVRYLKLAAVALSKRRQLKPADLIIGSLIQHLSAENLQQFANDEVWLSCIVFSKDRPLQLDALLQSYFKCVKNSNARLVIMYFASTPLFQQGYDILKKKWSLKADFVDESIVGFKPSFLSELGKIKTSHLFFLVDDIVFTRSVDLNDLKTFAFQGAIPSLRLGSHLKFCYTMNLPQPLPTFRRIVSPGKELLLEWDWKSGEFDWGYPFSLDGNIFSTEEIKFLARGLDYRAPNTLERALNGLCRFYDGRKGVCFEKSKLLNIPANKVQTENANHSANSISPIVACEKWLEGNVIDVDRYENIENISAHQSVPLYIVRS